MNRLGIIIFILLASINLTAQQKGEVYQYSLKLDSSYLFIDNTNRNWYTLELETDTLFTIEGNIFFFNNKTLQIGSIQFDNGKSVGVMGSIKAEEYALSSHKKWELEYQKTLFHKKLKNGEEFYYGENGKPFLIWWFETPKNSKVPEREIETNINNSQNQNFTDTTAIELNATHQLFLDFIVHGNTSVTLSLPVLENETLANEINRLKKIANTLNVYGSYIDLKILSDRLKDKERKIVLRDSLDLIEVEIPSWLNVCRSPYKEVISISFPEKENITNGVAIICESKSDSVTFDSFKSKYLAKGVDANSLRLLNKEKNKEQYFFTKKDAWFYGQNIFLEGEKSYCYINFIATKTTYDFNLERLYKLVEGIKIK